MSRDPNVVRDLVQTRILGAIFSKAVNNEIVLKGGFAMRVLTGSARYTKDIDLAASPSLPATVIQGFIRKALADIRNTGLIQNLIVTEPKQTDTTQKWKIGGTVNSQEIHFTIELSRRNEISSEFLEKVSYRGTASGNATVPLTCINLTKMCEAKFDCIKNPNREAPRDIYDLFLLISMDVKPTIKAIQSYGQGVLDEMRNYIWDKLDKMDYHLAREKLLTFMPPEVAKKVTEGTWEDIRLKVGTAIEDWIDEAKTSGNHEHLAAEITDEPVAQSSIRLS